MDKLPLPIDTYLDSIVEATRHHSTLLIKASPGSGKTTRLPWALLKTRKKVLVLEPRRLAAKLAAQRIAQEEGLTLGQEIGYQFRFEKNLSSESKLIFYTEGMFLRKLLEDTELSGVDTVVLDEFHERHLDTDLALAFLRSLQKNRPELLLILMSATLDLRLQSAFPDSKVFDIVAPNFPVEIRYLPNRPSVLNEPLEKKVRLAVESVSQEPGDILIFLPGMREMLRCRELLAGDVHILHADLSKEEQEEAISPGKSRKIILATNIAESSVTIPGVRVVIDSGIQREAFSSPWTGLTFIKDALVTKSSAIQRAGRAGRTGPGICLRLYSQQDFEAREEQTVPELFKRDLTSAFLFSKALPHSPSWFQNPPEEKWSRARTLAENLGALLPSEELSPLGKKLLSYPIDPRLARVLIAGEKLFREERRKLLQYVCEEIEGDPNLLRKFQWYLKAEGEEDFPWEKCVLQGFVDQIGRYREAQRDFIHYSGKTLKAHPKFHDFPDGLYLVLDVTQKQEAFKVLPIDEDWTWELEPFPFTEVDELIHDGRIQLRHKTMLGSIVMEETVEKVNWEKLPEEMKHKILLRSETKFSELLRKFQETPAYGRLHHWCHWQKIDLESLMRGLTPRSYFDYAPGLEWDQLENFLQNHIASELDLSQLERDLPFKINLGGKRELTVHYPLGMDPYLEAPIQDFYGQADTPRIMGGKIPLTLKLLGPHKRPIQVTKDLKNFWAKTYQEMKKEYQREYPKHYWPERPWEARPFLLKSHLPRA
jgi:ATP-dependent helicase HrpB